MKLAFENKFDRSNVITQTNFKNLLIDFTPPSYLWILVPDS